MNGYTARGSGIYVHESVQIGRDVIIGHGSCIGFGDERDGRIVIGDGVQIGAYCVVDFDVEIGAGCYLDHYCKVGGGTRIGPNTRILYGKHVYDDAVIGANCIIGGHVADRTIIEDDVTYFGEIAHSHRDPTSDWDTTEEESPHIYRGSVIGINALIIGGRKIGPCAYVGAGEVLRTDLAANMILLHGKVAPVESYRGLIKTRCAK